MEFLTYTLYKSWKKMSTGKWKKTVQKSTSDKILHKFYVELQFDFTCVLYSLSCKLTYDEKVCHMKKFT